MEYTVLYTDYYNTFGTCTAYMHTSIHCSNVVSTQLNVPQCNLLYEALSAMPYSLKRVLFKHRVTLY